MISCKRISFNDKNAVAIHFQNMTHLVKTVQLESKILEQQIKVNALQNYASIMQHEFKAPIATSVSFLETILFLPIPEQALHHVRLVISQMHMLMNLIDNLIECKSIIENNF